MSEYQYYEFLAIDHPLGEADREALRKLSTRASITAVSFTNSYEWGDFKGSPAMLMERWFDLHVYLADWRSRRLMIRLPARMIDRRRLDAFLENVDSVELSEAGENLVLDIVRNEIESEEWDDGSGWLAALAPLRSDMLSGDLRPLYLLWLMAVEEEQLAEDVLEPMAGLGPMTEALETLAAFFDIDPDLVQAAAERSAVADAFSADAVRRAIATMPDREKTDLLARLFDGAPHVAVELRAEVRRRLAPEGGVQPGAVRTVADLRARATAIRHAREQEEADRAAAERRRQAQAAAEARRARLEVIARQGERAWREVETEIERRNPNGYDKAAGLLLDLQTIADEQGTIEDFLDRLRAIRDRHERKGRFIERLAVLG